MNKFIWQKTWNPVTKELTFEKIGRVIAIEKPQALPLPRFKDCNCRGEKLNRQQTINRLKGKGIMV